MKFPKSVRRCREKTHFQNGPFNILEMMLAEILEKVKMRPISPVFFMFGFRDSRVLSGFRSVFPRHAQTPM